jgi:TRAP transporter TAXI family solute receptor
VALAPYLLTSAILARKNDLGESMTRTDKAYRPLSFRALASLAAPVLAIALTLAPARAEGPAPAGAAQAPDVNDNTVGIVAGTVSGTYIQFASDLSNLLDAPGKLRIMAVLGKGSMQNIEDVLKVRGIDLGIVQSDVLTYIRKKGLYPEAVNKLQYVTKLYNEELHMLSRPEFQKLEDLRGKKVNFGLPGSGIAITCAVLFDLLNIKVDPTYDDPGLAIEKLKRGEIAASAGVYGKPAKIYDVVKAGDKLKFLPVPPTLELTEVYFPSTLTAKDYPQLVAEGSSVETIAVGAVMIVYGWEPNSFRYKKTARFVDAFFANFETFQNPPAHPKWREVSLITKVPGWTRFPAAEDWLKRAVSISAAGGGQSSADADRASFQKFITEISGKGGAGNDDETRLKLFLAYEAWKKKQAAR